MGKISQYNDVPVPKLSDMLIGTSVGLNEQDQVENQTYNFTLQQLLDLFVPNIPSNNLQGVLDNGNTATQDINLFGKITTTDLEVTNDATFNNAYFPENMYVPGLIFDETYESGVDGQVLSRSATGVKWVTLPPIFTPNLQQVLNVGNVASTNIQLSATLFADAVDADDITSNTSLTVNGELVDGDGSSGLNNQVLTSTGSGKVEWKDQITYSGVAPISVDNGTKQISISQAGSTTNGYLSSTDWNAFDSKQDGLFGTGIVKSTAGVITYITDNSADWNSAYNDTIVSAGVVGTTTKTLTLTQRDGGTITASWSDIDTAPVTSVFGRTGDVVAQTGDYTTTQVTEGTNLYYLDSRARAAISLTTIGSSGPATYNSSTGILNIPDYGGGLTGYVPYTGATSNVNLGERGITSGYVAFDLTPTGTPTGVSTMYWDSAYRTVSLIDGDGDTTLQIGQEERVLVHNNTGSTLTDGQVVYITGSTGNLPSVALASAASESTSAVTIGVVTESIAQGADGFVTVSGMVNGLNTLAFTEGDMLWLGTTPGTFTNVKPISPNHLVLIGYVVKRAGGNGSILVKIQNTQELAECSDVLFDIPEVDGQVLSLQTVSGTQLWRNRTIPAILGYTPISLNSLSASSPLSYNNTTGAFSIQQANGSQNGFLSSADWNTFNSKVSSQWITSGSDIYYSLGSVLVGTSTSLGLEKLLIQFDSNSSIYQGLNILDSYSSANGSVFAAFRKSDGTGVGSIKRNGTTDGLFIDGGINLALGVANTERISINSSGNVGINKTNPTVALDVVGQIRSTTGFLGNASTATALASPRTFTIGNTGKSFDGTANVSWTLGEIGAQAAGNYITSLTGEATATGPGAASVTLTNSAVTGKVLTGVNITGGSINDTDSILTAFGKVQNQINGLVGGSIYQGTWNASTNTPSLASGVGTKGYYYIVSVAGSTNLDGITDWNVGDWAIFDGTAWQQVDNTDAVVSVNGFTGAVSLTTANIPEASNLYYTDARARAALSFAAGSGAYNSTTGVITIPTNTNQLTNGANFITLASLSASSPLSYNNGTGAFSITQANSTTNGFLSSTDWNTFNNKQNALVNPITGTGTTNYIPKFTGSTSLGNSQIFDNGTNVGVGTASPSLKLDVNGDIGIFNNSAIQWRDSSNNYRRVLLVSGGNATVLGPVDSGWGGQTLVSSGLDMLFRVNGSSGSFTNAMYITPSGNVGLGTTSPNSIFDIRESNRAFDGYGNVNVFTTNTGTQNVGGSIALGGDSFGGTTPYPFAKIQGIKEGAGTWSGALLFGTTASTSAITERMRITSVGNVWIGGTNMGSNARLGVSNSGAEAIEFAPAVNSNVTRMLSFNRTSLTWITSLFSASDFQWQNSGSEVMRISTSGNLGLNNNNPSYRLDVSGSARVTNGILNSDNYFEKLFTGINFPHGVANLAYDINIGNISFWGYIEVEITGTFANQNTSGKLTKTFAVGTVSGGTIFTNQSRISDAMGTIPDNIAIGDMSWNSSASTFRIPISHIVSSGNDYTIRVRMFTHAGSAKLVFDSMAISSSYTLTALSRQYPYFNDRLGIGTTNPTTILDLGGVSNKSMTVSSATSNRAFYGAWQDVAVIGVNRNPADGSLTDTNKASADISLVGQSGNGFIIFGTTATNGGIPTERMRITSSGDVGIGTASPNGKIDVIGENNKQIASFRNISGAVGQTPGVYIQAGTNSSDYSLAVYGAFGSSHVYVRGDGNVGLGTTSPSFRLQLASDSAAKPSTNTWTISSDERIKENINPYEKGLETILAINPVTYDYNGKAGFAKIKGNIGIIAQDIKDILPESISTYKAKLNEDDEEETELLNFNSHALTYVLINAIKEQQKQIEELKTQITRLI